MDCPKCKGTGEVKNFLSLKNESKEIIAKSLRESDYTIREIAEIMGYKSPRSVQVLLK